MRSLLLLSALCLAAPSVAAAEDPPLGGPLGYVRPTENDGFGELKWGADLKTIYAKYPDLKKNFPMGKVAGILKSGQSAILETKLSFKGQPYYGRLYLDGKGLYRVTIEVKIDDDPSAGASAEKALDPLLGDLGNADEESGDTRIWKGAVTVVAVTRTRQVGSSRLDISFTAKEHYRPESAGGSLGIE